jgi:hypothetical protein
MKFEMNEPRHDCVVVPLGDSLTTRDPITDVGIAFFEQVLELAKLGNGEPREMLICEGAEQQIRLLRAAVPSPEPQLATQRLERFSIVGH